MNQAKQMADLVKRHSLQITLPLQVIMFEAPSFSSIKVTLAGKEPPAVLWVESMSK